MLPTRNSALLIHRAKLVNSFKMNLHGTILIGSKGSSLLHVHFATTIHSLLMKKTKRFSMKSICSKSIGKKECQFPQAPTKQTSKKKKTENAHLPKAALDLHVS